MVEFSKENLKRWEKTNRIDFYWVMILMHQYQNFVKMSKTTGYIIILNMCATNENHMICGYEIESAAKEIFSHFGPFFLLYPSNKP